MNKFAKGALALAFVGGLTLSASAQLLYSFETQNEINFAVDEPGGLDVTFAQSTIGATLGSSSLQVNLPSGSFSWWAIDNASIANTIRNNTTILVDVTVVNANPWQNMMMVFNSPNGFSQANGNQVDLVAGTQTVAFQYQGGSTNLNLPPQDSPWFKLTFSANSGAPLTYYIDNIRAVPEPMTMSVLAAGLLGLAARRKRK